MRTVLGRVITVLGWLHRPKTALIVPGRAECPRTTMTVRDAVMGVRGRPDCQRSHPGTLRECPGTRCTSRDAFGRPETDSVSQDGRKRPGRLQRPGRSMASKTALASRTRLGVPGRGASQDENRASQTPRAFCFWDAPPASGTGYASRDADRGVRDVRSVPGCSRAVPGRSVPGRVGTSRNGKPVLRRGKSSRDARVIIVRRSSMQHGP